MSETQHDIASLRAERDALLERVGQLEATNDALMDRVERSLADTGGGSFGLFQRNIELERLVGSRTRELDDANRLLRQQIAGAQEAHDRLEKIAAHVPGMVYQFKLRPDGTSCFPYASHRIREIYGVEPQDVAEDGAALFAVAHEDDRAELMQSIAESARDLTPWRRTWRNIRDGETRWVYGASDPQRAADGSVVWHGFVTDITEQKRAQEHQRRLALIAERTDNIVILADANGRVEWVNPAFTRLTGYTLDEVRGKTPGSVLQGPGTDPATVEQMRRCLRERVPCRVEVINYDKHGRQYWIANEIQPVFDDRGELTNFMAIESDITERKQAELQRQVMLEMATAARDEAEKRSKEMEELRELAEAANRAKSQFLANMSHEIRTPMTGILGFTELLQDPSITPEQRVDYLETIRANGKHLLVILNDVLDLSKIEAGQMSVERIETPLRDLIAETISLHRPHAEGKGIRLRSTVAEDVPAKVLSDPVRLRQVVMNLVGNAIKFTEQGEVSVEVRREGDKVSIAVSDTGIGMTAEQAMRLFRPFQQADTSMTRRFGGTGLGLTISKRLAQMLGGDIAAASERGKGSRFTFTFDAGAAAPTSAPAPAGNAAVSTPVTPSAPLAGRVLLAEDGPTNQKLLSLFLKRAGLEVELAENGRIAVDRVEAAEREGRPYDLVLMDMQMPEMDGYTATRTLRSRGYTRPVLALTAHAMTGDRDKCVAAGCDDYACKPIDQATLVASVTRLLRREAA